MAFAALKIIDYGLEYYAVGSVSPNMGKSHDFPFDDMLSTSGGVYTVKGNEDDRPKDVEIAEVTEVIRVGHGRGRLNAKPGDRIAKRQWGKFRVYDQIEFDVKVSVGLIVPHSSAATYRM